MQVEDRSTAAGDPPRGMRSWEYQLSIFEATDDNPVIHLEAESGDDATSAQALVPSDDRVYILGDLEDESDIDVFSITVRSGGRHFWRAVSWTGGPTGTGSTTTPMRFWITDPSGTSVWAESDFNTVPALEPSLPGGEWLIWVEHPGGSAGANDFYVLFGRRINDNPRELDEAGNDAATADGEPIMIDDGRSPPRGFISGFLPDGDQDHWSLTASVGDEISAVCGSLRSGSGVIGLTAELIGPDGATVLASASEDVGSFLALDAFEVSEAGTHWIRLSKRGQEAAISGDWYRCGITRAP